MFFRLADDLFPFSFNFVFVSHYSPLEGKARPSLTHHC
jgi:hypothetical protein